MLKKFLPKKNITNEDFLKELSSNVFNEIKIEQLYNSNDIDIEWRNENNETMLHYCSKKGYAQAVKWLIANGANIEALDDEEATPIFYSINSKDREVIYILIENKANVNHLNIYNRTVLQEAVLTASNKFIDILIQHTKNLNNCDTHGNNLIFDAIANGNPEIISKIARLETVDINKINEEKHTILHKEVILKNHELAMQLLELGADPTIQDEKGKNFLFYAVSKGSENKDVIKKAVELGCDINTKSSENITLLMESINYYTNTPKDNIQLKNSHLEMIKELINLGVNVCTLDINNENILFKATKSLSRELIDIIINLDEININHKNINSETVLFDLVLKGGVEYLDLIKLYLEKGSNPNIKNKDSKTIVEILIDLILYYENNKELDEEIEKRINPNGEFLTVFAFILKSSTIDLDQYNSKDEPLFFEPLMYYNFKLFKILKKFDIEINQKDRDGNNILFKLMEVKNAQTKEELKLFLNTLQSLINLGVDVYTKNRNGESILHRAIAQKDEYTFKLLLSCKTNILAVDNLGRTIMHVAILKKKGIKYFKLIHHFNKEVVNIADSYGFRPINYAAFMGQKNLVISMLDEGVIVNNTEKKDPKMLNYFKKFHKNILKLKDGVEKEIDKGNLDILINTMKEEFNIKEES